MLDRATGRIELKRLTPEHLEVLLNTGQYELVKEPKKKTTVVGDKELVAK